MRQSSPAGRVFVLLMSLLLLLPLAATASDEHEEETESLPFSKLSFPEPERHFSATQECVQPEAEMRRNHMKYILHQRDETVHEGIRTRQYSLEECINCHAAKDDAGDYLPVNGPDQFCSSCHAYTAVHIDCFQCHATKPERPPMLHGSASGDASPARLNPGDETLHALVSEGQAK